MGNFLAFVSMICCTELAQESSSESVTLWRISAFSRASVRASKDAGDLSISEYFRASGGIDAVCTFQIKVVGQGLTFTSSYRAIVEAEFAEVAIVDCGSLAEAAAAEPVQRGLCLVEEEALWPEPDKALTELDKWPDQRVAVAYTDARRAAALFAEVQRRHDVGRFSFLPMDVRLDCWVAILRLLTLGHGYIPAELVMSRPAPRKQTFAPRLSSLTPRESEILHLASEGKQNKVIAFDLGVSEHTVKLHMHHLIQKLGVRNRTEAVGRYLQTANDSVHP
ncbi:MAG: Response regulator containing a CheY-like receiver domain and an HTH DNA-binding domain [Rhodobacteraceae bacterium HLUCCA09]|nr:MAG: Response regulator containing a CheY-like receiver domain and an HTH DNA-binding domain [Rhodobacteraceae bacterium HLUCCA09]